MPDILPLLLREVVHVLDRLDHHALHGDGVVGDLQHHRCRRQGKRIPGRRRRMKYVARAPAVAPAIVYIRTASDLINCCYRRLVATNYSK